MESNEEKSGLEWSKELGRAEKLRVLILDDEKQFTEELHEYLDNSGFDAVEANTPDRGMSIIKSGEIDLLILDVRLPGISGLDLLKEIKAKYPKIEVIVVSAHGDMDTVIKALRLGAIDYLRKPFRHIDIQIAIGRTQKFLLLQQRIKQMEERNSLISKSLEDKIERRFIGNSQKIKEILEMALTAARFPDTNVLITGESGTGKENVARIIHYASDRKDNLFWTVNSSAITDSLLESEFFGHKKGSFTGAISDKKGFFEICDQGTLFLDEIADMPINLQAKILRAIEEKTITPVGDTRKITTDFRIISATHHDLYKLVEDKRFRLDLLHRMNTLHIHIPPLRERPEDIEPLLVFFAQDFATRFNKPLPEVSPEVFKVLMQYDFPGNVRELKNMSERAVILCKGKSLEMADFPFKQNASAAAVPTDIPTKFNLEENEMDLIRAALRVTSYNQKAASDKLGITRDALIRKMKKYGIFIKKGDD
jgi:DNA-binding NtrC family response regulator